jgi:hypothetical protein
MTQHKAEMAARARSLGLDYADMSTIILSANESEISLGRAIEMLREMTLRAVDRAVAEERAAAVAFVRGARLDDFADSIERGEHLGGKA